MINAINVGPDNKIRVVNPDTGEQLDHTDILDLGRDAKVSLYGQVREAKKHLSTLEQQLKLELNVLHEEGEIVSAGSYGGVKLKRTSSRRWDGARVAKVLARLVETGVLKQARADAAAPTVETIKPDGKKLNALLQELAGTEAGADLASTKTDSVNWTAEIVTFDDVAPVPDQEPTPAESTTDPSDAFFGAEVA